MHVQSRPAVSRLASCVTARTVSWLDGRCDERIQGACAWIAQAESMGESISDIAPCCSRLSFLQSQGGRGRPGGSSSSSGGGGGGFRSRGRLGEEDEDDF
jgi:hypothetical protein